MSLRLTHDNGDQATRTLRISEIVGRRCPFLPSIARILPAQLIRLLVTTMMSRFFHIRDVLSTEIRNGKVLVTDCRDVVFQDNPFRDSCDLEFAQEHSKFGEGTRNDLWYRSAFGDVEFEKVVGQPIFCAGTIVGRVGPVLKYIDSLCRSTEIIKSWRWAGIDQAAHNWLIYGDQYIGQYQISTNSRGSIATTGRGSSYLESDGLIVDDEGRPFPILHQFDRLPESVRNKLKALGQQNS